MSDVNGILKLKYRRKQSGKSYIAEQYYQLPLQVLPPYYPDDDGTAFTYILNPTGGILQNDRLVLEVDIEENARAFITTPSAGKFYKMEDGHAELINGFTVGAGAVLEYMPEYNIPFAASRVNQETVFCLARDSVLIASDMILPGRIERGELFEYDFYSSKISLYVENELLACEYVKLEPNFSQKTGQRSDLRRMGVLQGNIIYAMIILYSGTLNEEIKAEADAFILNAKDVSGGCSCVTDSLAVVKLLGNSVTDLQEAINGIWAIARRHLLKKDIVRIRKF